MLRLFYAPNACSLAPHIALNEAGADYEAVLIDTKNGEQRTAAYLAINPKARVPSLATDRGILTEVPVLLGYIARNFPKAELAPTDGFDFFEMQSFNTYLASTIHITYAHLFRPERYADSDAANADLRPNTAKSLGDPTPLTPRPQPAGGDRAHLYQMAHLPFNRHHDGTVHDWWKPRQPACGSGPWFPAGFGGPLTL